MFSPTGAIVPAGAVPSSASEDTADPAGAIVPAGAVPSRPPYHVRKGGGSVPLTGRETILYRSPFLGVLEIQLKDSRVYSIRSYDRRNRKPCYCSSRVVDFINSYFAGDRDGLRTPPPLFLRGTVFQQKVWAYLQTIPYGEVRSYTEVARAVGSPRAVRAVGSACGKNPYLILVPCHRVVAKKGLGGFALGLIKKRQLLNHEQKYKQVFIAR